MKIKLSFINAFRLFVILCILLPTAALPANSAGIVQAQAPLVDATTDPQDEWTPTPEVTEDPITTPQPTQEPEPTATPELPADPTQTAEPEETQEPEPTPTEPAETLPPENASNLSAAICATVTQIPLSECEALMAVYNSTNGPNWVNKTGWNTTNTPCEWYGVTCAVVNSQLSVTQLVLSPKNNLVGTLPPAIGNLTNLKTLNLTDNILSGSIPSEIGSLTKLEVLWMAKNYFTGAIPDSFQNLTALKFLNLETNLLSGPLPAWISSLISLEELWLGYNAFSGSIPTSFKDLKNLRTLWLIDNQLSGPIPPEIGQMTALADFNAANNQLTGTIPEEIKNTRLRLLQLSSNQLTGIPTDYGLLNFQHLDVSNNQIEGIFPSAFSGMVDLEIFNLANNKITGTIPDLSNLTKVWVLNFENNQISGEVPSTLGSLSTLQILNLSGNSLSGEIPASLGNLANLTELRLSHNQLTGLIPDMSGLTKLNKLYLNHNQLSGTWPVWLENIPALEELNIGSNYQLGNVIPSNIGSLLNLRLLDISRNHFWGEIPLAITNLVKLNTGAGAYTDIGHNHLTSKNTAVRAFLARKDPDWEKTQTPINPVPVIQGLNPPSVLTGHPEFVLQVRGRSMMNGAVVYWDGIPMATTHVNNWTLEIVVPAAFMENEGEAVLTAKNPWPTLGPGAGYKFYISDLFPANGSTVLTRRPLFRWPATQDAERYQLQLSTAGNFSTLLMTVTSPTNVLTLTRDLPLNRIIYWRVRPMLAGVYQAWSVRHQFRSANPPSMPALSSPANNALTTNYKPRLVWSISSLPTRTVFEKYELQIATDPSFEIETIVLNEFITTRSRPNYTVGEGVLAPNMRYFWRVRSFNTLAHYSNWSAVRSIRAAILPPVLVEPVQGSTALTPRPLMKWEPVKGATAYQIQFSLHSNFSELLQSGRTNGIEFTPASSLPQNRIIHWRVRATGPNGPSLWARGSFRSANPPSRPTLASPGNNALVTNYTPTLSWNASSVPVGTTFDKYILEVATDRDFQNKVYTETIAGSRLNRSFQLPSTDPNTRYFWRVQSWNTAGQHSIWSVVRSFRTAMLPVTDLALDSTLTLRPTFTWTPPVIAGAGPPPTSYTIQFSLSPTFGTLITSSTPRSAAFTPTMELPRNRTIYWRVRANGEFGPTLWAGPSSFLSANPPSIPTLVSPANGAVLKTLPSKLDWSNSTVPAGTTFARYEVQIATNTGFTVGLVEFSAGTGDRLKSQLDWSEIVPPLQSKIKYFWRVRSVNSVGHISAWSTRWSFTTP